MSVATPSQTIGPFFSIGMGWCTAVSLAGPEVAGNRIGVAGRVLDGDRAPVVDAVLEIWQPDARGFRGFGRVATAGDGTFRIETIRPRRLGDQAPHLALSVFARGLLRRLITRLYLPDDVLDGDPVLARVPADRRATLVARPGYVWDLVLQGHGETVFFEVP